MTSRRPMTRSYSGNGRSNSLNEEDSAPSSRADSRNYLSNVRPENSYSRQRYSHYRPSRSTFCSVMSQLTEETQPCFETTIKSKAVSESCNAKFSCVVTGYPAPEITWYKDDMELDRYCGLPKYEIFRNGKTHTLHIYNCTLDDAAIYQASARNSKGIVSCSGVLEVGDMSEYKIHQRFFAKLKQKAELKRREMEESRRREREIAQQEQFSILTQDRIMRKRRTPDSLNSSDSAHEAEEAVEDITKAATETPAEETNGEAMETATMATTDVVQENGNQDVKHVSDTVEIVTTKPPNKEKLAKKKIRISNGFDENMVTTGQTDSVSGNEKHANEQDMSLAQYLSQSVQSQAAEDIQSSVPAQTTMEVDIATQQEEGKEIEHEKERERERERKREKERELEKERKCEKERERDKERERLQKEQVLAHKERERAQEMVRAKQLAEAKKSSKSESNKAKKSNADPQQKSTLTTVLTSLKDIFFGKSKNKSIEASEETSTTNETDWQTSCGPTEQAMEVDEQSLSDQTVENIAECPRTPRLPQSLRMLNGHGIIETKAVGPFAAPQTPEVPKEEPLLAPKEESLFVPKEKPMLPKKKEPVSAEEVGPSLKEKPAPPSPVPSLPVPESLPPAQAIDDQPVGSGRCESPIQEGSTPTVPEHDTKEQAFFTEPVTGDVGDILSLQGPSGDVGQTSAASLTDQVAITLESIDSHGIISDLPIATEAGKVEEMHMDKGVVECDLAAQLTDTTSSTEERSEASESVELEVDTTAVTESVSEICTPTIAKEKEITTTAEQGVEEGEEKVTEANEPEKVIEVEMRLEEKIPDSQGDMMEVSSVVPPLGVTVESSEQTAKAPNAELHKDASVDFVVEGQKVESSATETKEEVEEMETEVHIVEAAEVQYEEPDYQGTMPVIIPPASELQGEGQKEKDREAPNLPMKDTVEIPSGEENVIGAEVTGAPVTKIPDIKISTNVEIQEQLPVNIPTVNILTTESEESKPVVLVMHNLAGLQGDATQLSDPMIVEPSTTVVSTLVSVPPTLESSGSAGVLPPMKEIQEVAQAQDGERMSLVKESKHAKTSSKVISSSIPTIKIAEAITVVPSSHEERDKSFEVPVASTTAQQEEAHKKPAFAPPPIEITCVEKSPEIIKVNNNKQDKDLESLADILWGVKNNIDQESHVAAPENVSKAKEQHLTESKSAPPPSLLTPKPSEAVHTLPVATVQAKTPQISISNADKIDVSVDRPKKDKAAVEKLGVSAQLPPMMSPSSLRRLMAKGLLGTDNPMVASIPAITVDSEGRSEENSGGSTPSSALSCESSPKVRRKDSPSPIPSATPEELASGARRKIFLSKIKVDEVDIVVSPDAQGKREAPYMSPSQARRAAFLQAHSGQKTPPMERRSPLLSRRKATLEVPKVQETPEEPEPVKTEVKPTERLDPFKAPQVIRKIRGEPFSDATGHLKLWCQFFNVLSDSTITWYRDEVELLEVKRSAGDESQVALAIVQASSKDCGVFACTIKNDFGTDTTDFLLSTDILAEFLLRDELEVGEEIEMTPLLFTKGLADPGSWGDKFFGRIMVEEMHLGEGIAHKACRVKVIYGLDPVFESGSTCITKVRNFIVYGTKEESNLIERNLEITKQLCRMQNIVREYCKIFAAEARVIENFGPALEVSPVYLMYRPANTVPYATVEAELKGTYLRYCFVDSAGHLVTRTTSEVEQKCSTFQHWIHQWTNGNLLVTQLEGVDMKVTNIRIANKTKGYQGLTEDTSPKVLEQFLTHHQCNYYCGLMGLRPLKPMDMLQQPSKMKGSRSPLLNRKAGSSSPQLQRKGTGSPQTARRIASSPKVVRKSGEAGDGSATPTTKHKTVEIPKVVRMR